MPKQDARVAGWAEELLGAPVLLSPLTGGANNYLFRCQGKRGELVIKRYRDQNFGADVSRRTAELAFLRHATIMAPGFVPKILDIHPEEQMIAMSLLAGDIFRRSDEISQRDITAAVHFYQKINEDPIAISHYPVSAREGFRSISEHLRHVEQRLSVLRVEHLNESIRKSAQIMIDEMRRSFERLCGVTHRQISAGYLLDTVPVDWVKISPGDFGFHNAIKEKNTVRFYDFEYSGTDDPTKTLADLFLQPKIPIAWDNFYKTSLQFSKIISDPNFFNRVAAIGKILSIKWRAIMMGPLDKEKFQFFQCRFYGHESTEITRRIQLASLPTIFE